MPDKAEVLAQFFHEQYEQLAPMFGYETRPESAVPWEDVPTRNKLLMTEVCRQVLMWLPTQFDGTSDDD